MAQNGQVVGVDLGGTKVLAGVVGPDGKVLSHYKHKTAILKGQPAALLDLLAEAVRSAVDMAGVAMSDIAAVGVGVPGSLNLERTTVAVAPNLGWSNVAAQAELKRRLAGMPIVLENDVRCAALAEHTLGSGAGHPSMVAIFIGTGVGGGLIRNGELLRGTHGGAGEVGHVVIRSGGPVCSCGQRGCLEAMAARPAVTRRLLKRIAKGHKTVLAHLADHDAKPLGSTELAKAVGKGDREAVRAVKRSARYAGEAAGGLVNLLDPNLVVLGGGVVDAVGQQYVDWASEAARPHILAASARNLPIVAARLGDDAGLLGAALAARQGV